jgi:copper resistance protein B
MRASRLVAFAAFVLPISIAPAQQALAQSDSTARSGAAAQHAGHQHAPPPTAPEPAPQPPHDHRVGAQPQPELPAFIPRLTEEDRKAAFPDLEGHAVHDDSMHSFVLFDQLEWQAARDNGGLNLDSKGWVGFDRDRLWFRAEGDSDNGRVGDAQAHVLYGRQVLRWWDVVAGLRQDFRPGPAQTWAAVGVQGLAPYWFEIEATAYLGASGRTQFRFEIEYELLLTNRLVLQPLLEVDINGKSDPERGVGAGFSTTHLGFRLRYELKRELAPYIGVTWNRKHGETADFAAAAGGDLSGARFVTGLRLWF